MKDILEGDDNFKKFSECCEKKSDIEKQLKNSKISDEERKNLKERLDYLNKEISKSRIAIENKIRAS